MKLIQLNTWTGRMLENLHDFYVRQDADILCLQEVLTRGQLPAKNPIHYTLERFANDLNYSYIFHSPTLSYKIMRGFCDFGPCVASKFPFAYTNVTWTRQDNTVHDYQYGAGDYNARLLQHVTIDLHGTSVNILNHHAHHEPDNKQGSSEFLRQMKLIANYVDDLEGPVILCGDFNAVPDSPGLIPIKSHLHDLPTLFGVTNTRTILKNRQEVIDYIFVNDLVKVKTFKALDDPVSDHKALVLDFTV